jgi:hypothetical protein
MKKYVFVLLWIFSICTFAQSVEVADTIRTVTLQGFNAPSVGALVLGNVTRFDFSAELYDANMSKLRDCKEFTQKPKKEEWAKYVSGGRGTTVWVVVHDIINEAGTYYLKATLSGSAELGNFNRSIYYMVIVENPTLASTINLRSNYFYSEGESFSFATVEYTEPNSYSYKIVDPSGAALEQGQGAIVKLDKVLSEYTNVGKTITIQGFYENSAIYYKNNSGGTPQKSEWQLTIDRPNLTMFSGWIEATKDNENTEWMISVYNNMSKMFLFGYMGVRPGGFVFAKPEIRNLQVTSDPPGFLAGAMVGAFGVFPTVNINVSEDFMNTLEVGGDIDVKLSISFRTQFETVRKEFRATVIK